MAYPHHRRGRPRAGAAVACCLLVDAALSARAQDVPAPQPAQPPALSAPCEAPASDIFVNAPLPNVTKAINQHKTVEILAVGSAATNTIGIDSGIQSYPVQLENMLKYAMKGVDVDVVNRGTGGEVAQTTAERIRTEVALLKPDLVLWQLGTNDALARVEPDQFTDIVKTTIDWLKENDIDVALVGLQYTTRFSRDESYFAIKKALEAIARRENILYVKRYDAMKFITQTRAKVHLMTNDNYHLSELGTQCQAEHITRAVIASVFVRRFRPGAAAAVPGAPVQPMPIPPPTANVAPAPIPAPGAPPPTAPTSKTH